MKFIATASAGDVTTYRAKGWAIVNQRLGFDIPTARIYAVDSVKHERFQIEFAGKNCVEDAMAWCRNGCPETDFATHCEMTR